MEGRLMMSSHDARHYPYFVALRVKEKIEDENIVAQDRDGFSERITEEVCPAHSAYSACESAEFAEVSGGPPFFYDEMGVVSKSFGLG